MKIIKNDIYKFLGIMILVCFFIKPIHSQEKEYIQLNGIIMNEKLETLPFVHTIVKHKRGAYSDKNGLYSVIVERSDTIIYTHVGYKKFGFVIPDTMNSDIYTVDVIMLSDTINIEQIIILPWHSYEEFKQAFKELDLPDDDLERARRNIALIKTQMRLSSEPNPYVNFREVMSQEYEKTYIRGQFPGIALTDPLKWAEFFEALKEGKFKKEKTP